MVSPSDASALGEGRRDSRVGVVLSDRYRIDALVDKGAMGRVYVGEHVLMRKRVAIKVLHRELTMVPEFVARFEREAMAAANIQSEHVVAATDFGKLPDGAVFLVLEYIEGKNLRDEMAKGAMPLVRSLHIARQIAIALQAAHELSIVHRDLKPENVMLVEKAGSPDFVKVLDFGIAKVPIGEVTDSSPASKPITKAGMVFGTPEYMPPEQALGQSVDERADLYSLGVILYEMLAGVRPFTGSSNVGILGQQLSHDAPSISERAPGVRVPPPIQRFIAHLLARESTARVQSARDALDEIDQYLGYSAGRERIPTLRDGSFLPTSETDPAPDDAGWDGSGGRPSGRPTFGPLRRLGGWIDSSKRALPRPLRRLPAPVLFSVPMAAVGLVVGIGVVNALSPTGSDAAPQASASSLASRTEAVPEAKKVPARAPEAALDAATAKGLAALAELGTRFPEDARIPLARSGVQLRTKDLPGAVASLEQALQLDPTLAEDTQVASALWILAQNKTSSAQAFTLLLGRMGERGRSILKDLATTPAVKKSVRDEASRVLSKGPTARAGQ